MGSQRPQPPNRSAARPLAAARSALRPSRPGGSRRRVFLAPTALALEAALPAVALRPAAAAPPEGVSKAVPAFVRAQGARPQMPSGVAAGDATERGAVVWSRTDRP